VKSGGKNPVEKVGMYTGPELLLEESCPRYPLMVFIDIPRPNQ
jgi:hypothetical protein